MRGALRRSTLAPSKFSNRQRSCCSADGNSTVYVETAAGSSEGKFYASSSSTRVALGKHLAVPAVLEQLDASLARRLAEWDEGRGFASIRTHWAARALGLGGAVTATSGTRHVTGTFRALAPDGALLLEEPDGTLTPIHAGEVSFAELERQRRTS